MWTPRQRVFSPIDESQRLVSKGEKQGFIAHLPLEKAWLAKGLRTIACQDFGCKPIFSLGEGFFLCATNNWKTTEVGIPYRMSGPFSIYLHLLLALVVRAPTVHIVGTVTNLSRPYQEILIVSSARMQLSGQTRRDGHLATDQTRRPPVASSHAKTHGQLKELHIPSWATARPCLRPLTSLCILGSELVVHHFCQLDGGRCPAPRYARYQ